MRIQAPLLLIPCLATALLADPGSVDPTFTPTPSPNGSVRAILVLADGSILVGGEFTQPGPYLAKYQPDGSFDTGFAPIFNGAVHALESSQNGVLAGGAFTTLNGSPAGRIALLDSEGQPDPFFMPGTGFDGPVHAIHYARNSIYIGGDFDNFDGHSAGNLAQLSRLGPLRNDFEADAPVKAISGWFGDGVAFGGSFSTIKGRSVRFFATAGQGGISSGGLNVNGEIDELAFRPQILHGIEAIALGGSFTSVNGTAPGFAAFTFRFGQPTPIILSGASPPPSNATALIFDSAGDLVVANESGSFWRYENLLLSGSRHLYRRDVPFMPMGHANGRIDAIAQGPTGLYYAGGNFPLIDRERRPNFARLYGPQGTALPPAGEVGEIKVTDDRAWIELEEVPYAIEYLVEYRTQGGSNWWPALTTTEPHGFLLGLQPDCAYELRARVRNTNGLGNAGTEVNITTSPPRLAGALIAHPVPPDWFNFTYGDDLLLDAAGRLGVVGLNDIDGELLGGFAILDDQLQVLFALNDTNNPRADRVAPDPRGGFVVESSAGDLQRLTGDGQPDPTFTAGYDFGGDIRGLAVQSDGKVLVAGTMQESDGDPNDTLMRLNANGSVDTTYNPDINDGSSPGDIEILEVMPGDRLLAVGEFNTVDGITAEQVVILNPDGTVDTSFSVDPAARFWGIDDATVDSMGRVLLAGGLEDIPEGGDKGVMRLLTNGAIDTTFNSPVAMAGFRERDIEVIKVQPDGRILAGGTFDTVNDNPACSLIRLNSDGTVDPTFSAGLGLQLSNRNRAIILDIEILPDSTVAVLAISSYADGELRDDLVLLRGDETPSDWSLWLGANGLPPDSDPASDDDGDGVGLGIEFAYRLDPGKVDSRPLLAPFPQGARITLPRQRQVLIEARFSETLELWQPIPVGPDWSLAPSNGMGESEGYFRFEVRPVN